MSSVDKECKSSLYLKHAGPFIIQPVQCLDLGDINSNMTHFVFQGGYLSAGDVVLPESALLNQNWIWASIVKLPNWTVLPGF